MKAFCFILCLTTGFISFEALAGDFKIRAREHFDIHTIQRNGSSETFRGLSNTINIWYEKPYDISYGFAFNPVLGSASQEESDLREIGTRIRFIHAGLELKYFFMFKQIYTRIGAGWSQLRSNGPLRASNGYHGYAGLGWEINMGQFGLALEVAYRAAELQNHISTGTFTPSIGFHFYEAF